ncbi:2-amino-4-hydroxy-6-hydroxymethyldihydropteridine diphosphokinase [Sphingobium sp. OAS761]|uniref:2-amino-4-hydroxy-6- hydroxymethyldihydropteridine diphosphokinase n=1 Tax=Sphingobium sp. OAS761 TaxID=2817901 RepID=UPI0020A12AF0|nr:2-amino-4-hydroxy-6-hydroxymethyldihydropteridine diphosphokinase [Sphingobium sp. OAS761]MCP1470780.1 2-amino-4-hydroxy-6-hydroxymethyldihydropteridine diphosphokinase [Sphingobium sp. OAS761]
MMQASAHLYLLALGSNRPLSAARTPARLIAEAAALIGARARIVAQAPVFDTAPVGPSSRRFANSALLVESPLPPPAMLALCQAIETGLGRRRYRRWGARSMDIDIILWSGGRWRGAGLTVPHPAFRTRPFVLAPAHAIHPHGRDPETGLRITHLRARAAKARAKVTTRG